jgi:hypothetical protein
MIFRFKIKISIEWLPLYVIVLQGFHVNAFNSANNSLFKWIVTLQLEKNYAICCKFQMELI